MNDTSRNSSPVQAKFAVDYQIVAQNVPVYAVPVVKIYQNRRGIAFSAETRQMAESRVARELWTIV